jgi:hypothetical protein
MLNIVHHNLDPEKHDQTKGMHVLQKALKALLQECSDRHVRFDFVSQQWTDQAGEEVNSQVRRSASHISRAMYQEYPVPWTNSLAFVQELVKLAIKSQARDQVKKVAQNRHRKSSRNGKGEGKAVVGGATGKFEK